MAIPFDTLGIAASEIADASERRTERMVNPALSNGLTAFLTTQAGVNSGFMIVQYAAASMVSENKVYAHPASVDSIPPPPIRRTSSPWVRPPPVRPR